MFGRAEFVFSLDGTRRAYAFGKEASPAFFYEAREAGDRITIRVEDEKHRKPGAFYKVDAIARDAAGDLTHAQAFHRTSDGACLGTLEAVLVRKTGK